jgi:hypothetical protein
MNLSIGTLHARVEKPQVAFVMLRHIEEVSRLLLENRRRPMCFKVTRTRVDLLALPEAARIVRRRMRELRARKRRGVQAVASESSGGRTSVPTGLSLACGLWRDFRWISTSPRWQHAIHEHQ